MTRQFPVGPHQTRALFSFPQNAAYAAVRLLWLHRVNRGRVCKQNSLPSSSSPGIATITQRALAEKVRTSGAFLATSVGSVTWSILRRALPIIAMKRGHAATPLLSNGGERRIPKAARKVSVWSCAVVFVRYVSESRSADVMAIRDFPFFSA